MENKTRNEHTRDSLNRLSADFEVELLRLIKTLNLISQSKELYKNQIDQIEAISKSLQLKINDFTIKLLEIEKTVRLGQLEERNNFSTPDQNSDNEQYEILLKEINEFRDSISGVNKDIERAKVEHLSKLDSYYSVYNLELKASQGELDTKLSDLKDKMVNQPEPAQATVPEPEPEPQTDVDQVAPTSPPTTTTAETRTNGSRHTQVKDHTPKQPDAFQTPEQYHDLSTTRVNDAPKRSINLTEDAVLHKKPSSYSSNSVLMAIIFLFFLALVGAGSYYLIDNIRSDRNQSPLREEIYTQEINPPQQQDNEPAFVNKADDKPTPEQEVLRSDNTDVSLDSNAMTEPEITIVENNETVQIPSEDVTSEDKSEPDQIAGDESTPDTPEQQASSNLDKEAPQNTTQENTSTDETESNSEMYTVVGIGANVRSGPGINHQVSTVVLEGQEFAALGEKRGNWIKVLTPDGTEGWISKKVVRKTN